MNDETTYQLCKQAVSQVILVDMSLWNMYYCLEKHKIYLLAFKNIPGFLKVKLPITHFDCHI